MRSRLLLLLILFVFTACSTTSSSSSLPDVAPGKPYRIIGYVYRRAKIEQIDATKLTHINYAFAKVRGDDQVVFEEEDDPDRVRRVVQLKAKNPDLKIILSIGGWGAEWFSDAALTEESRCRFTTSAIALMREHDLDGLDLDWEYPGQAGAGNRYRPEDKENFTLLLAQLRRDLDLLSDALGRKGFDRYVLTIASSGNQYFAHTEMEKVHAYLDWINVMTYDFTGGWSKTTGHHTALYGPTPSTEAFIRQHLAAGIPPRKIVVGAAFYAKGFRWVTNRKSPNGINEAYDLFMSDLSYSRLERDFLNDPRYEHGWDSAARAPYLWDREVGTFLTYDDPRSLREKAHFVKELGLGGVMYWEHSHDPREVLLTTLYDALRPLSKDRR